MDGFATLVPDLYRGKITKDYEEAGHLMSGLDWPGAVGVTGFCMGGALSIAAAALVGEISAAAPFYGIPKAELCNVRTINIPVQAHFGDQDTVHGFSAPEDAQAFKAAMDKKLGFEFYIYAAGHGFTNPEHPTNYNKECADLALSRTVKFMQRHLQTDNV
ncbi:DLHH-like protein [Mya arenaria]|uniref:DLHH-like protein n=1 Tax=Mya arenaria TaxID=6604 RepID=A0ABY7EY32_MYAAR|nr:DLHH-like protein [Mya arenaria]